MLLLITSAFSHDSSPSNQPPILETARAIPMLRPVLLEQGPARSRYLSPIS
jgi:hypothetical protein